MATKEQMASITPPAIPAVGEVLNKLDNWETCDDPSNNFHIDHDEFCNCDHDNLA
jgi:hypothetical protein